MALPRNNTWDEVVLTAFTPDFTTAATGPSAFVQSPIRGDIVEFGVIVQAAFVTDNTFTLKVNGTTVSGAVITLTASGSGAGTRSSASPTRLTPATVLEAQVAEGDSISFVSGFEANDSTIPAHFYVILRMRRD